LQGEDVTLRERQEIFAQNVGKLLGWIFANGYTCTLGETYRTPEQAQWYADKGIGIKNSLHCKRLAQDLNLFRNGVYLQFDRDYQPTGDYWESLNPCNRWGGRFEDGNHFEMMERER
jgi:hypothetical protein